MSSIAYGLLILTMLHLFSPTVAHRPGKNNEQALFTIETHDNANLEVVKDVLGNNTKTRTGKCTPEDCQECCCKRAFLDDAFTAVPDKTSNEQCKYKSFLDYGCNTDELCSACPQARDCTLPELVPEEPGKWYGSAVDYPEYEPLDPDNLRNHCCKVRACGVGRFWLRSPVEPCPKGVDSTPCGIQDSVGVNLKSCLLEAARRGVTEWAYHASDSAKKHLEKNPMANGD